MITDKIAAPVTDLANPSFAVEEFFGGKIGMHVDGPWQFINIRENSDFEWDVAPMPAGPAGSVTWAAGSGFGISNTTENPDAAWTALKTITSTGSLEKLVEAGRGYPARESAVSTFEPPPQNVDVVQKILVSDIGEARPFVTTTTWQETTVMLARDFSPVFLGKQSVDAVVRKVKPQFDKLLAENQGSSSSNRSGRRLPAGTAQSEPEKVPWKDREHEGLAAGLFLLPNLIGFLIFTAIPVGAAFVLAFYDYDLLLGASWAGLENFREMFTVDRVFRAALFNTVYFGGKRAALSRAGARDCDPRQPGAARRCDLQVHLPAALCHGDRGALAGLEMALPAGYGLINSVLGAVGIDGPAWLRQSGPCLPSS